MKHSLFLLSIFFIFQCCTFAQKKVIDYNVYERWPFLGTKDISSDGKYVYYKIEDTPFNSNTTIVASVSDRWEMNFPGIHDEKFTRDGRFFVFINNNDSLGIIDLKFRSIKYITQVVSYRLATANAEGGIVIFRGNSESQELLIRRLNESREFSIPFVTDYFLKEGTNRLYFQCFIGSGQGKAYSLNYVDLFKRDTTNIWIGERATNLVLSDSCDKIAFKAVHNEDSSGKFSFWLYDVSANKVISIASDYMKGIDSDLVIKSINGFSKDEERLFMTLVQRPSTYNKDLPPINVWTYFDKVLQSAQLKHIVQQPRQEFYAVLLLKDRHVLRLNVNEEKIYGMEANRDYCWLHTHSWIEDWSRLKDSLFLISKIDGSRSYFSNISNQSISPDEKYIVYYDKSLNNYFSYEIKSRRTINLTGKLQDSWIRLNQFIGSKSIESPAGWIKNAVLLYSSYDIWEINLVDGSAFNLTNSYGKKNKIIYRLCDDDMYHFLSDSALIVTAFDRRTKENGFSKIQINQEQNPFKLVMGPYTYYAPQKLSPATDGWGGRPIKAKDAQMYVICRMSATESNNIYCTTDFKKFERISNIRPENDFNWMTIDLLSWKNWDGEINHGLLFKPENFDPRKKYPVIIYNYEFMSDNLYTFSRPEPSIGSLDIARYVSNGYLVFEPDIYFYGYKNRLSTAFKDVLWAAQNIKKKPYVDRDRLGLQGLSWGGVQVDYILTHTNIFAAACSASSLSDLVSFYGTLHHSGEPGEDEFSPNGFLWQAPEWYISNSAVLSAQNISTPLLMFETTHDGATPFSQGLELFLSLRMLGKKIWMLEYEDGNHVVTGKSAIDFSIRMAQFFDYFLKGAMLPKWMSEGIPARMKGIDDGLQLQHKALPPNLLRADIQKKVNMISK